MSAPVRVERAGDGVVHLVLDRPEAYNAIDYESALALRDAVAQCERARVVVLWSEGPAFCVGGDLATFAAAPSMPARIEEMAEAVHAALVGLWRLDAVVVTRLNGVAAGIGVPLAAAGDLIIASATARLDLAYVRVGLTPDGGTSLLLASIGLHRLLRMALLSPAISATEAKEMGLVAEVVEPDALDTRVEAVVRQLLHGPAQALVGARRLLRDRAVPDPVAALAAETALIVAQGYEPDAREGITAFLEKRLAQFG